MSLSSTYSKIIVSKDTYLSICASLANEEFLSLDTETTGLRAYNGDRLFSIIIGTDSHCFYFNFKKYSDLCSDFTLNSFQPLQELFQKPHLKIFLHNAKFDMHMLAKEGIFLEGHVLDTMVFHRILDNEASSLSLKNVAKSIGLNKDEKVEEYILKYKLYTIQKSPTGRTEKNLHFDRVPFSIISEYALNDARITYLLGRHQYDAMQYDNYFPKIAQIEAEITKILFGMEMRGIQLNSAYVKAAFEYHLKKCAEIEAEWKKILNEDFLDSGKNLARLFNLVGVKFFLTEKGNPSFTEADLEEYSKDHRVAQYCAMVREYRKHYKKAHTFFGGLLKAADPLGVVHAHINQAGTRTGRFSMSNPNLQNQTKEEDEEEFFPLRKSFIPREDYFFVEMDYKAMEFRLMLDRADQMDLAKEILNGVDPHQATADMTGLTRRHAKTLNFGLLYGMGVNKLAEALGVSLEDARLFRQKYFSRLPKIEFFIRSCTFFAETRGHIRSWIGRKFLYPDTRFAYKACNAVIQGGCSDIVRIAMCRVNAFLANSKSALLLQVHDSLLFEIHKEELHMLPELRKLMAESYDAKFLPMDVDIKWSAKSWGELEDFSLEIV